MRICSIFFLQFLIQRPNPVSFFYSFSFFTHHPVRSTDIAPRSIVCLFEVLQPARFIVTPKNNNQKSHQRSFNKDAQKREKEQKQTNQLQMHGWLADKQESRTVFSLPPNLPPHPPPARLARLLSTRYIRISGESFSTISKDTKSSIELSWTTLPPVLLCRPRTMISCGRCQRINRKKKKKKKRLGCFARLHAPRDTSTHALASYRSPFCFNSKCCLLRTPAPRPFYNVHPNQTKDTCSRCDVRPQRNSGPTPQSPRGASTFHSSPSRNSIVPSWSVA